MVGSTTPFDRNRPSSSSGSGKKKKDENEQQTGYVVISGDYDGGMNVFVNLVKPKHSSLPTSSIA